MSNEIRVGKISAVDHASGMVRVVYHDKDDSVTQLIPMIANEYRMPEVDDMVLVLHLSNGLEAGVVMGRYWTEKNKPPEGADGLYRKDMGKNPGDAVIRYDGNTLSIKSTGRIAIDGGSVTVNGVQIGG